MLGNIFYFFTDCQELLGCKTLNKLSGCYAFLTYLCKFATYLSALNLLII
jgi:hypothetical protein